MNIKYSIVNYIIFSLSMTHAMEQKSWFSQTVNCFKNSIIALVKSSASSDKNKTIVVGASVATVALSSMIYLRWHKSMLSQEMYLTQKKLSHVQATLKTAMYDYVILERDISILELERCNNSKNKKITREKDELSHVAQEATRIKNLLNQQKKLIDEITEKESKLKRKLGYSKS